MFYGLVFVFSIYILIFGVVLGLFAYFYTNNNLFKGSVNIFLEGIDGTLIAFNTSLGFVDDITSLLENVPPDILKVIYNVLAFIKNIFTDPLKQLEKAKNEIEKGIKVVADHVGDIPGDVKDGIEDAFNNAKNFTSNTYDKIKGIFDSSNNNIDPCQNCPCSTQQFGTGPPTQRLQQFGFGPPTQRLIIS